MFDEPSIRKLMHAVASHEQTVEEAVQSLRSLPFEEIDCATLDHHRELRRGCPEVIYCAHKTPEHVAKIAERLAQKSDRLLGTRAGLEHFQAAKQIVDDVQYDEIARCIWFDRKPDRVRKLGITLIAAGTSDFPVAQEAARTLLFLGHAPQVINDVGVAGLHRLLAHLPQITRANVVIVVAGMEGALPSVVSGLVSCPVIAVPTSVGYGANFGGLAALLGMLNSCSSGVGVVNIDNGYGAACLAASINSRIPGGAGA